MKKEPEVVTIKIPLNTKYLYINEHDYTKLVECGKLVQLGKLKYFGYATGKFIYRVI